MKAIVHRKYGSPDVLELAELPKPDHGTNLVRVKVRAASVNPADWHGLRGQPYLARLSMGLTKPKIEVLGHDFAGTVEAVGENVTGFAVGDEVFGMSVKTLAEFVCVSDVGLTHKPSGLSFEQAAASGVAALTALQGLRDRARLKPGEKVLINGASGGVGTFAVQMAKSWGATVTGVCSTRNVELVRSLGADEVIDYTQEDFCRRAERYDVICDAVGNRRLRDLSRVLTREGRLVLVAPGRGQWIRPFLPWVVARVRSRLGSREMGWFLAKRSADDMELLRQMLESEKLCPVIDRTYALSQAAEAVRYVEQGHARGKVVITV